MKFVLAVGITAFAVGALAQGAFTNGSFEIPGGIPEGTSSHIDSLGSPLVGWAIGGSGGMADLVHGQIPSVGIDFPPVAGEFHVAFNGGDSPAGRSISQTFSTEVGSPYEVTFHVGKIGTGDVSLNAAVRSSSGETLTNYTATPPSHGYSGQQRITFFATTPETTLTLLDTSPDTVAVDLLLDAVSVVPLQPICAGQFKYHFTIEKLWDFSGMYFDDEAENGTERRRRNFFVCKFAMFKLRAGFGIPC